MADRSQSKDNIIPKILDIRPLVLEASSHILKELQESSFAERMSHLREKIGLKLGIVFPPVGLRENRALPPREFVIKVREVEARRSEINGQNAGLRLESELADVIERYASEFLGPEAVSAMIDHAAVHHPELVASVYPQFLSLQDIRKILQNLVSEKIPIRDLTKIFEAIRDYLQYSRDPEMLTEYVRHALARLICSLYHDRFVIKAFVLENRVEQLIAGAVRWEEGTFIDLDQETAEKLADVLQKKFRSVSKQVKPASILIVSPEIRRFVKLLMERIFPEIPVLSGSEIAPEYQVKILGEISLDTTPLWLKKILSKFKKKDDEHFPGDNLQKALLILNWLGNAGNQVTQYFNPSDRDALRARGMAAPVPSLGKDEVVAEFLSYLPREKNVKTAGAAAKLAMEDPAMTASIIKKNWLDGMVPSQEMPPDSIAPSGGRMDTDQKEKAAIFIAGAARWVQDEVYRWLTADELRELGLGMLQFPFISAQGKRKAWEDSESIFFKEEWWDSETLSRFLQASLKGKIDEFKKRPFRRSQKLAILLLSLPETTASQIGKEIFSGLPKGGLQRVLAEMTQWRDQLPAEIRFLVVSDFLSFAANSRRPDFAFTESILYAEVERMIHRDSKAVANVLRKLWLSPFDALRVFTAIAAENPRKAARLLLTYYFLNSKEIPISSTKKLGYFLKSIHPDLEGQLLSEFSESERKLLAPEHPTRAQREKILSEFLRAHYASANIQALCVN